MASPKTVCFNIDWATATISDIKKIDVKTQDDDKQTPLHWAARHSSNPEIISTLLESGADINASDNHDNTPLHEAAMNDNNPQIISTLLKKEYGAVVNARNKNGWTPLHNTARFGNSTKIIKALVDAGASIKIKTDRGATPPDLLQKKEQEKRRNLSDMEKVILFDD